MGLYMFLYKKASYRVYKIRMSPKDYTSHV